MAGILIQPGGKFLPQIGSNSFTVWKNCGSIFVSLWVSSAIKFNYTHFNSLDFIPCIFSISSINRSNEYVKLI